jgi:hypothetical protein
MYRTHTYNDKTAKVCGLPYIEGNHFYSAYQVWAMTCESVKACIRYLQPSIYAQNMLDDHQLAEEAVQDTFRIACTKPNDLSPGSNPSGCLLNTLKYVIYNMIRCRAHLCSIVIAFLDSGKYIIPSVSDEPSIDLLYTDLACNEDSN